MVGSEVIDRFHYSDFNCNDRANHGNLFCGLCLLLEDFLHECCLTILQPILAKKCEERHRGNTMQEHFCDREL